MNSMILLTISGTEFLIFCIVAILIIISVIIIRDRFANHFTHPKIQIEIDITGRKQASKREYIEEWLIEKKSQSITSFYNTMLSEWQSKSQKILKEARIWKKHKQNEYQTTLAEITAPTYKAFVFIFYRNRTAYRQRNYHREAYTIADTDSTIMLTLAQLVKIEDELQKIGYVTTTSKYNSNEQRKLLTTALRLKIMERDNYTCQECGKYMPDEVGLHVDHIVPISAGGKTVEDNLRVLCDKCNLKKGAKT